MGGARWAGAEPHAGAGEQRGGGRGDATGALTHVQPASAPSAAVWLALHVWMHLQQRTVPESHYLGRSVAVHPAPGEVNGHPQLHVPDVVTGVLHRSAFGTIRQGTVW
jgi:hypothetical protein